MSQSHRRMKPPKQGKDESTKMKIGDQLGTGHQKRLGKLGESIRWGLSWALKIRLRT